jgi:hypothetical protein
MADEKLTITRDQLYSPEVDEKLKQQEARARAAQHTRWQADAHLPLPAPRRRRFWYNPVLTMAFFGLLGGLSAWGIGEVIIRRMDASKFVQEADAADRFVVEAKELAQEEDKLLARAQRGELTRPQLREAQAKLYRAHAANPLAKAALEELELVQRAERGELNQVQFNEARAKLSPPTSTNPLIAILLKKGLTEQEREMLFKALVDKEMPRLRILEMLFLCAVGVCLAFFLAVADPVLGRNWRAVTVNGSVGILLGMIGGALVALFINTLYHSLGGGRLDSRLGQQMLARTICWGVLGLFLAIAPGVALRSWKRLAIGLAGGLIGGLLGGLLFDPLGEMTHSGLPARLLALTAIGVLSGAGTGLIEQAARRGWLYVTAGLIAGKQFILYRNPTFIGSSPRCEVYLFKDPDISPQHAALHQIPGGFELEDFGSATGTRVNGRPVKRRRLRGGDQVQIGSTCLLFQEKARARAAEDGERENVSPLAERPPAAPEGSFTS